MPTQRQAGLLKLAIALAALAGVWLVVLPLVSEQSRVSRHIEQQQRLGIDPSAMFYSELEIVPAIAHRVERMRLIDRANIDAEHPCADGGSGVLASGAVTSGDEQQPRQ